MSEVIFNTEDIVKVDDNVIESLKAQANSNQRKRMRLCLHRSNEDVLHEMIIVHSSNDYVRPHKHLHKSETNHIIEGSMILLIFNDEGKVVKEIKLGEKSSGSAFVFRIEKNQWHSVIPITDFVVFHEITLGPFTPNNSLFPSWAPEPGDTEGIEKFLKELGVK